MCAGKRKRNEMQNKDGNKDENNKTNKGRKKQTKGKIYKEARNFYE
jgi:hypothetical protein